MISNTTHYVINEDSRSMTDLEDHSVDLVVTSPPYPMISMWDDLFISLNPGIKEVIQTNGMSAFELMHQELDKTWNELKRVVRPGGIVCINIGDATRKINDSFMIYPNHSRIISKMVELGFDPLPEIIWHKQTNAPNKFMGSGMLPCGAYVTLEHEYILIFRNGSKREFDKENKELRSNSAYFWEERNDWFTDVWEVKGKKQKVTSDTRSRSAAYPLEIPKRLILMYSMYGDTVLDPFFGTGTTTEAAILLGRNSIGYELDNSLIELFNKDIKRYVSEDSELTIQRLKSHIAFIENRQSNNKDIKHENVKLSLPVMTKQEEKIELYDVCDISLDNNEINVTYKKIETGTCVKKQHKLAPVQSKIFAFD